MKKTLDIKLWELDDDDTIEGYRTKDLLLLARTLQEYNIGDEELKNFSNFTRKIVNRVCEKLRDNTWRKITMEHETILDQMWRFNHECQK